MATEQIVKCFKVIEFLAKNKNSTVDEMYLALGLSRSSIFRVLTTLEKIDYVKKIRTPEGDIWELDYKFLTISHSILGQVDIRQKVNPVLKKLSDEIKETVQLGVIHNNKVIYIERLDSTDNLIKISFDNLGYEFEVNSVAAGMVLAAYLDKKDLEDLLKNSDFKKHTKYTIVNKQEFKNFLIKVKENGYAFNDQGYALGVRGIAAPIFNYENKVVGAINITGHIISMTDNRLEEMIEKLKGASKEASQLMGFHDF